VPLKLKINFLLQQIFERSVNRDIDWLNKTRTSSRYQRERNIVSSKDIPDRGGFLRLKHIHHKKGRGDTQDWDK